MYLALIAVNQKRVIRSIENDLERFEKHLYRYDAGRVLVGGDNDSKVLNAILFDILKKFFCVGRFD